MDLKNIDRESLLNGITILINKPLYWTSFDAVNKIKFLLKHRAGLKKIKIGHAGTLDPLASGLLIVCVGKKTKSIEEYQSFEKEYSGSFFLGSTTPSFDLESEIDNKYPIDHINHELILKAAESLTGSYDQIPPAFSAKKIGGKRAYELARKGKIPEMKPKKVHVSRFNIEKTELPIVKFNIVCSKGTYIRSLARDFGKALNAGAYLKTLCRERIGEFSLKNAFNIDEINRALSDNPNFLKTD